MEERVFMFRKMDRLWGLLVAHQFSHRCITCGLPGTDPHHWAYVRSIYMYRWHLNNGVYTCRLCHNKATQNNNQILKVLIEKDYPALWKWSIERPPVTYEPMTWAGLLFISQSLERTAKTFGIIPPII